MKEPTATVILDEVELALRLAEAATGERRKPGLEAMDALMAAIPDANVRFAWLRAARAAAQYFIERTALAQQETNHEDHPARGRQH